MHLLLDLGVLWQLLKGKAALKQYLASRTTCDPSSLPYNTTLLNWLKQQKANGRTLVLCTASNRIIATAIAKELGLFDDVIASDSHTNLRGKHKASVLVERYGKAGFDYIGNAKADLAVWRCARRAIVVNAPNRVRQQVQDLCEVGKTFTRSKPMKTVWWKLLRVHQWLKNILLLVPLFAAHRYADLTLWPSLLFAVLAFCLCASAVYITNDLFDLTSDRLHPRKCQRPFAAGYVSIKVGIGLIPILLIISFTLAMWVNHLFAICLLVYLLTTSAYSWRLKQYILIDCLVLALLYTLRLIAGAVAIVQPLSFWLIAFSIFLFLSLAFVKRYAELEWYVLSGKPMPPGRGYRTTDITLIQTMGVAAGYAAIVVLALYLNSDAIIVLYRSPTLVWGAVPILLFWINWVWMQAHRGNMHDDPLVFAFKDKVSLLAGGLFAAVLMIGMVGWPW